MKERAEALRGRFPRRLDVPAAWAAAAALLALGLTFPIATFTRFDGSSERTYNVLGGIRDLLETGHPYLAALIFTFSLVFPLVKLGALAAAWLFPLRPAPRVVLLERLKLLGKWSMLDVFVVACLLGVVRFGWLTDASPRAGIYLYAASILTAMALVHVVARLAGAGAEPAAPRELPLLSGFPLEAVALVLLGLGCALPLMHVEKWVFWTGDFAILTGVRELWVDRRRAMAALVAVFVILVPAARLLCSLVLRFLRRPGPARLRLLGLVRALNRWSMAEVFALGLLVVTAKIGRVVTLTPQPGLWCFLAAAGLSMVLYWPAGRR